MSGTLTSKQLRHALIANYHFSNEKIDSMIEEKLGKKKDTYTDDDYFALVRGLPSSRAYPDLAAAPGLGQNAAFADDDVIDYGDNNI